MVHSSNRLGLHGRSELGVKHYLCKPALAITLLSPMIFSCNDLGELQVNYHNRILFSAGAPNNEQLFMVNPDGTDLRQLTTGPFNNHNGYWSSDASRIAFNSSENGSTGGEFVFVMDSDGKHRHSLDVIGVVKGWSRDNTRIVFVSCPLCEGGGDLSSYICVVNADGTGFRQLTTSPGDVLVNDDDACFSADGMKIYFDSNRGLPPQSGGEIYVVNADGSGLRRLTYFNRYSGSPAVSPDGKMLAFWSGNTDWPLSGIYTMNTDTTALRLVIADLPNEVYTGPRWSPDGSRFVIRAYPPASSDIGSLCVLDASGNGLRTIVNSLTFDGLDWSR
ncbi:MAG TPA: hypothetical protein VL221_00470 [Bacteroidota bacterium]|nr:hypothetical protein [Bacteroidota bacterium]